MADARSVERDLATYYDQEADERAGRELQPPRIAARDAFIAALPAGATVLEIGVGTGRDANGFIEAGHAVVGVDLSPAFAQHARATGAAVTLATARALPFRDASFDALWTMSTLMHIPNTAIYGALRELRRVLSPTAVAAIGVWGGTDVEDYLDSARYSPPRLFSRRSDERWVEMLRAVGTVEHFERWDDDGDPFWYQYAVVRAAQDVNAAPQA
jgi:SAM-dependent methyltransferase